MDLADISLISKKTRKVKPAENLQQTAFWGRLKKRQGRDARAFDISAGRGPSDAGDLLVVLRDLGSGRCMAYVPFGPEVLPPQTRRGPWLEKISEQLRPRLPDECVFIRYDLPWQSPWVHEPDRYDSENRWLGAPRAMVQEMRMNFDTQHRNLRKAPTDLLPPDTVLVDVSSGRDRILAQMKPKTRYNIRLAERKGVRVRSAGIGQLGTWYDLYRETAQRHGMTLNSRQYFESVFRVENSDVKSPASVHLLLAEEGGDVLAGIIVAVSGRRATYLYGASSAEKKNLMAPYALQWEAISLARRAGCLEYDLFGVSPTPDPSHPMYGLYRFKTGFGGRMFHRHGCWDYPLDEDAYEIYTASEMAASGFIEG